MNLQWKGGTPVPKAPLLTSFLKSRCFRLLLTLREINSRCKVLYKSRRYTYDDFRLRINPTCAVRWPGNRFVEAEPIFLNLNLRERPKAMGDSWVRQGKSCRNRAQFDGGHFLNGRGKSTIAFSLEVKELGITAPEFEQLFVRSLLANLTAV